MKNEKISTLIGSEVNLIDRNIPLVQEVIVYDDGKPN